MALLASNSAIELRSTPPNDHLTATYILNDAVSMVNDSAIKGRAAEKETNKDYVTELDRKIKFLNDERVHVLNGETQADELMGGMVTGIKFPAKNVDALNQRFSVGKKIIVKVAPAELG